MAALPKLDMVVTIADLRDLNQRFIFQGGSEYAHWLADRIEYFEELAGLVVSGFYEDEIPLFRQGAPVHELEDVVTAAEVTQYVGEIVRLRAALQEVVGACRTKISMKEVARKALFPQKEVPNDNQV